jgi:uncharacterized protein YajQ (UPF0234 family)
MNLNVSIKATRSAVNQRFVQANPVFNQPVKELSKERYNLHENKMAVVNLEAALTTWKSIQNNKVNQVSEIFRTNLASRIRLSPVSTGQLPGNLMRHYLG